jgi:two-component system cell cycle sensor histidine kinase/response regulator CckA
MGNVQSNDDFLRMTTFELVPEGTEVILLVEDEDVFRKFACAYLKSEGYRVLEASNGEDAMEICRTYGGPIHVLITDLVMPGLGGVELARAAQKLRPALAVIFVSGYPDRTLNVGRRIFVQKPFSFDVLNRALRSLLDKNDKSE